MTLVSIIDSVKRFMSNREKLLMNKLKNFQKNLSLQPAWLKALRFLFYLTGSIYLINVIFLSLFTATYSNDAKALPGYGFGWASRVEASEVNVSFIKIPNTSVLGYVNMMSEDNVIHVGTKAADIHNYKTYEFLKHEQMHIYQKELVAEKSGGYPSYSNPLQTLIYSINLIKLNNDLVVLMPELDTKIPSLVAGLESSADCYATPSGEINDYAYYYPTYLGSNLCTPEQIAITNNLAAGVWPTSLSYAETKDLPKLYNYTKVLEVQEDGREYFVIRENASAEHENLVKIMR